MKCGPCSQQPLAPNLAHSAVLRAGRVTETGLWEQEPSVVLQRKSVFPDICWVLGVFVLPGGARGSDSQGLC